MPPRAVQLVVPRVDSRPDELVGVLVGSLLGGFMQLAQLQRDAAGTMCELFEQLVEVSYDFLSIREHVESFFLAYVFEIVSE